MLGRFTPCKEALPKACICRQRQWRPHLEELPEANPLPHRRRVRIDHAFSSSGNLLQVSDGHFAEFHNLGFLVRYVLVLAHGAISLFVRAGRNAGLVITVDRGFLFRPTSFGYPKDVVAAGG